MAKIPSGVETLPKISTCCVGRANVTDDRRQTDGRQHSETFAKMLHGRFVHVGKTVIDMQLLGCELHQNAFGGRAPPGPAEGAIALPQTS